MAENKRKLVVGPRIITEIICQGIALSILNWVLVMMGHSEKGSIVMMRS